MIRSSHWGLFASSSVVLLIFFLCFCACVNFLGFIGRTRIGGFVARSRQRASPAFRGSESSATAERLTWEGTNMVGVIIGGAELRNRVDVEQACVRRFVWRKGAARDP